MRTDKNSTNPKQPFTFDFRGPPNLRDNKLVNYSDLPTQKTRILAEKLDLLRTSLNKSKSSMRSVIENTLIQYEDLCKNFAPNMKTLKLPKALQNFIEHIKDNEYSEISQNTQKFLNENKTQKLRTYFNKFLNDRLTLIISIKKMLTEVSGINNNFLKTYNEISKLNIDKSKLSRPKQKEFNEILSKGDEIIELRETVIGSLDKKHPENNDLVGWAIKIRKIIKAFESQNKALTELKTVLLSFQ